MDQAVRYYDLLINEHQAPDEVIAYLGRKDRFFLLTHLCKRIDAIHPWLYARCREVEANPDGYLDLWSREHYKSTIITFAGAIQEILNDPDITIGIFSHSSPIAKAFLEQIKTELERNETLKRLYPDVLWDNPSKDAQTWSLNSGIVVRRKSNPKERTVEAWGLVDGQPVSKHFGLLIFDDVVTQASVSTSDQITKTTDAWELAQHLGKTDSPRKWHVGTRYNYADTYQVILDREALIRRIYPATEDGTVDGKPVFMTQEQWDQKKRESSIYTLACQMLQNPTAGSNQEFKPEYLHYYEVRPQTLNVYIMCDYAGGRKSTGSSNTAFAAIGVDYNLNKYLLDGACHKMSLTERWTMLKNLRKKWLNRPGIQIVEVGYERFGAQSDIEHFETMMESEGEYFDIKELNWPSDGNVAKDNRIRRLEPDLRNWRFFFPYNGDITSTQAKAKHSGQEHLIAKPILRKNEENRVYNLVEWFISNEYLFFPNTTKKDMLDVLSRIYDMEISAPLNISDKDILPEAFND